MNATEKLAKKYDEFMKIDGEEDARGFLLSNGERWNDSYLARSLGQEHKDYLRQMVQAQLTLVGISAFGLLLIGLSIWYLTTGERLSGLPAWTLYPGTPMIVGMAIFGWCSMSPRKLAEKDIKFKEKVRLMERIQL